MPVPVRLTHEFEGKRITTFRFQDRPCWIARQIGAASGYSHRGKRFVNKITGEWAGEFLPGHDYDLLQGDTLRAFRELFELGSDLVSPKTRSLIVLYEPGLHLALARTHKKVGRRLRRFLADEVLPALTRTECESARGSANPSAKGAGDANPGARAANRDAGSANAGAENAEPSAGRAEDAEPGVERAERGEPNHDREAPLPQTLHLQVLPPLLLNIHADRERRLLRQAMLAEARFRSSSLRQTVYTLRDLGRISDDTLHAYEVRAAEIALGQDLVDLRPAGIDTWESPEEIAERLGVSPRRVWRAIARLWIRGDLQDMVHSAGRRPTGDGRDSFVFLYPPDDVGRIERQLRQRDEARGERA